MKRRSSILIFLTLFLYSCFLTYPRSKNKELTEFAMDLSSMDVKLRGKLSLMGEYKGNLSTLTYDQYLKIVKENESKSNKGLSEIIDNCDNHLFIAQKNSFLIALYSKDFQAILYDDASTAMVDSIKLLKPNKDIPDLYEFISKTNYMK